MLKNTHKTSWLHFFVLFLTSCNPGNINNKAVEELAPHDESKAPTEVEVVVLEVSEFRQELLANGKISAIQQANLKFRTDGIINNITVGEGDRVKKGQLIATLSNDEQSQELKRAELQHTKAILDYQDQLLRLGYRISDTAGIDSEVLRIAQIRSGLSSSELELEVAQSRFKDTRLIAPFDGKVANMKAKTHNGSAGFDYICTLVNDHGFYIEFNVLEQELGFIRESDWMYIYPFSNTEARYSGKISNINPQVDESGMVAVKGLISSNGDSKLIDGMGVRISIGRNIPDQLVIPKEAVLDRQGRKVVFTATENGRANWNYVEIGLENSNEYTVIKGLKPGDRVIRAGNFNLAHDKPITVINHAQ
ncbi:efflux RND transporter periplasmic adaptor subunit [Parapedobacter sp. 10938]|uniref:efflux RND transporter periplasmic adaptor subunit n=1 Tax=Parapedobacter flavus TaxID=3110225 RepID=UPI002DBE22EA|nr:efflux RND transporter periplasmic adaptor subunit [Parapedobacter sp. 10938]MEC3881796.1 efflux RND transporter periplasmic adaptor subunit [Parapedobacter sp. 10938]